MKKFIWIIGILIIVVGGGFMILKHRNTGVKVPVAPKKVEVKAQENIIKTATDDLQSGNAENLASLIDSNNIKAIGGKAILKTSHGKELLKKAQDRLGSLRNYHFVSAYKEGAHTHYNFVVNFEKMKDVKINMTTKNDKITSLHVNADNGKINETI